MRLIKFYRLLLLTMFIPVSLYAQGDPQTTTTPTADSHNRIQSERAPSDVDPSPAENKKLEKYVWLTKIKKELSKKSCEADQYFMHCFDVDQSTCLQFTEIYLTACMDNLAPQIPAILTPKEAQKWGPMLVFCSHDLYTRFMADKKKPLPECESPKPEPQNN